ncbi:AAA family ATPase, partial [Bacteroides sp. OttesenSCG-928-J23]|nr:AAA family ATPase [Bacteroides sp. OttesenSCG-928-J23]
MNNSGNLPSLRLLPVGIQSFEKLRTEGFLYVDKTALMYELIQSKIPYFLSRPRRFGKSLLLSTMEAYFEGKKELFQGLAVEQLEKEWKTYPVLHLSLNAEKYEVEDDLRKILEYQLQGWEKEYDIHPTVSSYSVRFMNVIETAYQKTGMRVVVLIDEYDKPLLRSLHDETLQAAFRNQLTAFYTVLKDADKYLRFVFITGVTKFAQMGIFSNLNQLMDISFDQRYATICGMTQQEIEQVFSPELHALARENDLTYEEVIVEMARHYNGYHFSHRDVIGVF